jgi:phage shock protein A
MDAADLTSLAFVAGAHEPDSADPRERLDQAYQRMLEGLQRLRREFAVVATRRKQLELRLREEQAAAGDPAALTDLEQKVAAARRREEVFTAQLSLLQQAVDAFRTQKETAKAKATAAEALRGVKDAFLAAGIETDNDAAGTDDAELTAQTDEALARAKRLLESVMDATGLGDVPGERRRASPADTDVLELQADPLGADIRVLFAIEPPGTVTLLAAIEGHAAISSHRDEAIDLAGELLDDIRHHGWQGEHADGTADPREKPSLPRPRRSSSVLPS